jgi:hypothetical protein
MITLKQAIKYTADKFKEEDVKDRIEDKGFAFYINTQPREFLETHDFSKSTIGNGPLVIFKKTGEVYAFGSNPLILNRVDAAQTSDEFLMALKEINAKPIFVIKHWYNIF